MKVISLKRLIRSMASSWYDMSWGSLVYRAPNFISGSVWIPGEISEPNTISALSNLNKFLVVQRHAFFNGTIQPTYIQFLQRELDMTSADLLTEKLHFILNREYHLWYMDYAPSMGMSVPKHDWYVSQFGSFVPSPLESLYCQPSSIIRISIIAIIAIGILWRCWMLLINRKRRKINSL